MKERDTLPVPNIDKMMALEHLLTCHLSKKDIEEVRRKIRDLEMGIDVEVGHYIIFSK